MDIIGFAILAAMGRFTRWLLLGAKRSFKDFYNNKGILLVDIPIGVLEFFAIMYAVIKLF